MNICEYLLCEHKKFSCWNNNQGRWEPQNYCYCLLERDSHEWIRHWHYTLHILYIKHILYSWKLCYHTANSNMYMYWNVSYLNMSGPNPVCNSECCFCWTLGTERFYFWRDTDDIIRTTAQAGSQMKKRWRQKSKTWKPNCQWSSVAK